MQSMSVCSELALIGTSASSYILLPAVEGYSKLCEIISFLRNHQRKCEELLVITTECPTAQKNQKASRTGEIAFGRTLFSM